MKKLLFAVFIYLTSTLSLWAQFDSTKVHKYTLYATGDFIDINLYNARAAGGLELAYRANRYMSFLFPLSVAKNYSHFGLGTFIAPLGLLILQSDDLSFGQLIGGLVMASTMIESGAFHIPIDRFKEIVPYYSLFRIRNIWDGPDTPGQGTYISFSAGLKIRYEMLPKWTISAYAEYSQLYYNHQSKGIQSGVAIGYAFR